MEIQFLKDIARVDELVAVFVNNAGISYITHIEVEEGRADSVSRWSKDLVDVLKKELISEVPKGNVLMASIDKSVAGFALIKIDGQKLVIEDVVAGQKGAGTELLEYIQNFAIKNGIKTLAGDVGFENYNAQKFMKKMGYEPQTIVYIKKIN